MRFCHHQCIVMSPSSSSRLSSWTSTFLLALAVSTCLWILPAEGCDIAFFRHVVKTGGTAIRIYFQYYYPPFECKGQPRVKYGSRDYDRQELMDDLSGLANEVTDGHSLKDRDDIKYMIEIHNSGSSEKDVNEMLDLLDIIRSGGCNVLTFTVIREPLIHAHSDFHFFGGQYTRLHQNFSQFIMEYPENLIRRLEVIECEEIPKESRLVYYELDNVTYPSDTKTQQDVYQRTKEYLDRYDIVGTTSHLYQLWSYICKRMNLRNDDFHINPDIMPRHAKVHAEMDCPSLASVYINGVNDDAFVRKTLEPHRELFAEYNPMSIKTFEERLQDFEAQLARWDTERMVNGHPEK